MTAPKPITLADRTFDVPALPLRLNMKAYPLCRKLSTGGLVERIAGAKGSLDFSEDEMVDLAEIAFLGASAADPTLDRASFESLAVNPSQLLDAFFVLRYQTGGWVPIESQEGEEAVGEAQGEEIPQTSTSEESSQS